MSQQQAVKKVASVEVPVEEIYYRKGDIDFCFLLNRSHHNLRVFDYRVGNYQQKRDFFDRIARTENLRKVFTVVEKQDSKSWRSVGFSREGAIPGYFRTADAYVMSRVYTEDGDPIQGGAPKLHSPTIVIKEKEPAKPEDLSYEIITDTDHLAAVTQKYGETSLYAPFRRGLFHPDMAIHGRTTTGEYWVSAETDSSFGHAKIDVLTNPNKEEDVAVLAFLMETLLDELMKMETASVFALVAVDWPLNNQIYGELGFKVTARLTDHVIRGDEFVGMQLWHRRLAAVPGPRLSGLLG